MVPLSVRQGFQAQNIVTDNTVFRLHYQVTTPLLIAFGIIILFFQYLGKPINCMSKDDVPTGLLNSYCWMHSTYTVKASWSKKVGEEIPYPGIDKYTPGEQKTYNHHYQWVGYVFLLQAFSFYLPHYIWKRLEFRKINSMMSDLNIAMYIPENRPANENLLVQYFVSRFNRQIRYFLLHAFCEVLNVVNVITQLCITLRHFKGVVGSYGLVVSAYLRWAGSSQFSPLVQAFPRMAKCLFHTYGSSGDVQRHDAMCTLPINNITEKMSLFLFFWFIVLIILSSIAVLYKAVLLYAPKFRNTVLLTRARMPEEGAIQTILNKSNIGDWFMLDLMCTNLDSVSFQNVIHESARHLDSKTILNN